MDLRGEFERINSNHQRAIRVRAARAVLGSSVIRVFKEGTKEHLISLLSAINVDRLLSIKGQEQFREWFEGELSGLAQTIDRLNAGNPRIYPGYKWGHATKVLTLFIREVVLHSRYFADEEIERISGWLYVPIDSLVIKRLRRVGIRLPFDRINQVDSAQKFYYVQEVLEQAALECGVPRVWFDDNWGDRWTEACEVHGNTLRRGRAPVVYGMQALTPGYIEAQETEFPHSNKVVHGGCIIEEGKSPARQEVLYCQRCRSAERMWERSHGSGKEVTE